MKPLELLDQTISPDGTVIKLARRGDELLILANDANLMSSRMHGSEEALATFACKRSRSLDRPCVLIGGLGMGFTLRAALDLLPPRAKVVVAELVPAVVEWNRAILAPLAGEPLKDPRVQIVMGDVGATLRASHNQFDAIMLDVDNGPDAFSALGNTGLYDDRGIATVFAALKPHGTLAVWAAHEDQKYVQRLRRGKFTAEAKHVRARLKQGGPRHTIFLAHKSSAN